MSRIRAVDGAVLRIKGVPYPVPKGTAINIRMGNTSNLVTTGFEDNGDGSSTPLQTIVTGLMEDVAVRLSDTALEDSFNELQADLDGYPIVLENGPDTAYSVSEGMIISDSEDGSISVDSTTRKTGSFNVKSLKGRIRRQ